MQYQPPVRAESLLGLPQSMQNLPSSVCFSRVPSQVADFHSHKNSYYTTPSSSFPLTFTGASSSYSSVPFIFNESTFQSPDDSNQSNCHNLGMNYTPVSQLNYFQAATARHSTEVVAHNLSSNLPTYAQPSFTTCNMVPGPVFDYSMKTTTHDPVITIAGSNKNLNTCTFSDPLITTNQPSAPPANTSNNHRMETVKTMDSSAVQSISEHTHDFINPRTTCRAVPDVIKPYIEYQQGRYQRSHFPTYLKYPSPSISEFINLLIVHKKKKENNREKQAVMKYKIHGNTNKIKGKREPISMKEIGKNDRLPCFVLIEGDPGVGKTTLVWELCKSWAKGELLQEWDIVLLVQLRDTDMREADSIEKMIDPDGDYPELCSFVKQTHGERLLLIFDGFDELSEKQREKSSVFMRLLKGSKLSKSSIFVTSRPSATSLLPKQFYDNLHQHIEIVGFGEKDIRRYIDCKFKKPEDCKFKDFEEPDILKDFNAYILSHEFIFTLMYVPLHCALVTDLYEQYWRKGEKQFAPKTLTQLYTCLICSLLERHLEDVPQYSGEKYKIHEISDLPRDVYERLMKLSALAARGIENKEFVFENVNCETLGLLQKVSEDNRRSRNTVTSYSFLHLTLQEYLAALYWSKCGEEVSNLFEQTGALPIKEYFKKKTAPDIHWPALHFYAGLTGIVRTPLEEIIRSNQSTEYNYLYLLFECQCAELVSSVFKEGEIESTVRSHMEAYVTGHCIARSCESTKWKMKLKKSGFVVNLVHGIEHAKVIGKGGNICTLNVSSGTSDCDIIRFMYSLGQVKEYIENLYLFYETKLSTCNDKFLNLIQQFSLDEFVYERFGSVRRIPFVPFLEKLAGFKTLRRVSLCFDHSVENTSEALDHFSTLLCSKTEQTTSSDDNSLSVCSGSNQVYARAIRHETYSENYTVHMYAPSEWKEGIPQFISCFVKSATVNWDSSKKMLSVFTEQHEWLLGPNNCAMKICLHHKQSTDSSFLLCKYYEFEKNNFRVLVSPDNVGLLSNEILRRFELDFLKLTVLPVDCENKLIQTVVQSARDYNPGMVMRSVHLDLTLNVSKNVKTFYNKSYKVADISGTVVEKHVIEIAKDFIPTILQQCVLLKSSLINFSINASKCNLTISGAESLCTVLSESTSLKELFLSDIKLNSIEATLICKGFSNNCGLETVEFSSLKGDCSVLLSGLEDLITIKNLKIDACDQIGKGAKSLCTLLTESRSLINLSLFNIHVNSDVAILLSKGLRNNQLLKTLEFKDLKGDCSVLLSGLEKHMTIKNLTIVRCDQIREVVRSLLFVSQSWMKLSSVNICSHSNEAILISEGPKKNKVLETVEFKNLKEDCSVLLSGLEKHIPIVNLTIVGCDHIGKWARSLCTLLTEIRSLMKLSLINIHLNSDEAMLISDGLGNNQTLKTVEFKNLKGDWSVLLSGLKNHIQIKNLTIDTCGQIGEGARSLCTLLTQSRSMMNFFLGRIHLNSEEAMLILNGLQKNQTLETVELEYLEGDCSVLLSGLDNYTNNKEQASVYSLDKVTNNDHHHLHLRMRISRTF